MAASGKILARCHRLLWPRPVPGVTTHELDEAAEKFIRSQGPCPSFKGYRGFPGSICARPTRWWCTASPAYELSRGDMLSVDIGVTLDGGSRTPR